MVLLKGVVARYQLVRRVHHGADLAAKLTKRAHVHEMLGAVVIVSHASEIVRVVSEIKVWHLVIALLLFVLWLIPERNHTEELE